MARKGSVPISWSWPRYEPAAGSIVFYSAKEGHVAFDGEGGYSPFTKAFLNNVRTPNVDVRRVFDLIRDDEMELTGDRQQPFQYGSVTGREDFYFLAATK
jgi:hypothetical protein